MPQLLLGERLPPTQRNCASIHCISLCVADRDAWARRFCNCPTRVGAHFFEAIFISLGKHCVSLWPRMGQRIGGVIQIEVWKFHTFTGNQVSAPRRATRKTHENALYAGAQPCIKSAPIPPLPLPFPMPAAASLSLSLSLCLSAVWRFALLLL